MNEKGRQIRRDIEDARRSRLIRRRNRIDLIPWPKVFGFLILLLVIGSIVALGFALGLAHLRGK